MTVTASNPLPSHLDAWWRWLCQSSNAAHAVNGRRALLISYQFPPTGGSGVQRPAKLAKYLPAFGWSVEVLTAAHDRFPWTDESLLADLPDDLIIHRVAGREPACVARWIASQCACLGSEEWTRRIEDGLHWRLTGWADRLGLQGGESLWAGPAARAAIRRHREQPFDAVISTGPPHFVHRVAMAVVEATNLPWMADVRDPLVSDFDRNANSACPSQRMRELESSVLHRADAVVTTCRSFARDLRERYPNRAEHIHAITNGFDRADIVRALSDVTFEDRSDECVLVAAGAFYGRRELARIIRPLEQLMQTHPQWRGRVRLIVAGTVDAEQRRVLEAAKPEWVSLLGYLDHDEVIRLTAKAACAIIIVPECEHGQLSVPGKTFELLALPTHVLALIPADSDTGEIARQAGGATIASFENEQAVAAALKEIIGSRLSGSILLDRRWALLDAFDRRSIAQRFAACLTDISEKAVPACRYESTTALTLAAAEVA